MLKIFDSLFTVFLISLCFVILFVFNHTMVNGDSMKNTYQTSDRLVLDLVTREYKRGDIITVFADKKGSGFIPNALNTIYQVYVNGRTVIVKRVVALPGEEVEMIDKNVFVYNKDNPQGFRLDEPYARNEWTCVNSAPNKDTFFSKRKVPEGEYFVLGDNRGCSQDSRYYGTFKRDTILGKVVNKIMFGLW
ncbi:MAG: signal peptidase I [Patescibacteria group bacterium]